VLASAEVTCLSVTQRTRDRHRAWPSQVGWSISPGLC